MSSKVAFSALILAAAAVLLGHPARALAARQAVQLDAGELFGDRLTSAPVGAATPVLDDAAVFALRYTYGLSRFFALRLSGAYSPARAAHLPGGSESLGLTTADLDVLYEVTPGFTLDGHALQPYTELGVGYAWASLNHPLPGNTGTAQPGLAASGGYSANIGLGLQYDVTRHLFVDLGARYQYLSRLVDHEAQGLSTAETTVGFGYRFR